MIVNLTQHYIDHELSCPSGKTKIEVVDSARTGLYVLVTQALMSTYMFRYKSPIDSKTKHEKIARTSDISLSEARKRVTKMRGLLADGIDPRDEGKQKNPAISITEFIEVHYLPYAKQMKKTWWKDKDLWELRAKKRFDGMQLVKLTRQQFVAFHTDLKAEGLSASSCNHYIKFLRHALNLAVEWQMLDRNPISGMKLYREDNQIERYLDKVELKRLFAVLHSDRNRKVCNIIELLLLTGMRVGECLSLKWKNVDLENRLLRISADDSKSKRPRAIPLSAGASKLISRLDTKDKYDYLFINPRTKKPLTTINKEWARIRKAAGLEDVRCHDLRHSYSSYVVQSGYSLLSVSKLLGHKDVKVSARYAHLSAAALEEASNSASAVIEDAMQD